MGMVWVATHTVTRKSAALKFVRGDAANGEIRKRFLREARAAGAVNHPNVVEIFDVIELDDGSSVMVMEHLQGDTFAARLARQPKLSLAEVARIMVPVLSAVGTAHALGIVHRDLKPENIFLVEGADGGGVKVLDFGIAKLTSLEGDAAQTAGITSTGALLGTPYYMSPEQAFGEKDVDHRADIWALGIILYECLSGVLPTDASNIGQVLKIVMTRSIRPLAAVAPELPAELCALVDRMLSSDRVERPADLREAVRILQASAGVPGELGSPAFGSAAPLDPDANGPGSVASEASEGAEAPEASARAVHGGTERGQPRSPVDPLAATAVTSPIGPPVPTRPPPPARRPFAAVAVLGALVLGGLGWAWLHARAVPDPGATVVAGAASSMGPAHPPETTSPPTLAPSVEIAPAVSVAGAPPSPASAAPTAAAPLQPSAAAPRVKPIPKPTAAVTPDAPPRRTPIVEKPPF